MSKNAAFLSTDTTGVKRFGRKVFSKKGLLIALATLVIGAVLAALAYLVLMVSVFSMLGSDSPEKKQSAQLVHENYKALSVPSEFELTSSKEGCLAALDGCVGRMEYTYLYPKALAKTEATALMRTNFEKQGFTFSSPEQGKNTALVLSINQPIEATDKDGNPRLEVSAGLLKDQQ